MQNGQPIRGAQFPAHTVAKRRVLVIGDIMLDRYWFGLVDRISPEAPVPVVHVARREDRLGGAANVARNARALGAQVSLFGLIGQDEGGQEIARLLEAEGIYNGSVADPQAPTILKMRVLGGQQQLLRIDFEEHYSSSARQKLYTQAMAAMAAHDIVVLSDYSKGVLAEVEALIEHGRSLGIPILVDPKGYRYERYQGASMMTPNRLELREAVGPWESEAELQRKAQQLRQSLALDALLLTRSEEGMSLFVQDGAHHVAADAHEVFDVSGAGDTVLATLAACLAAGLSYEQAMGWANRAGGVVVGKLGTSVVRPQELV